MIEKLVALYRNYLKSKLENVELEIKDTIVTINHIDDVVYNLPISATALNVDKYLKKLDKLKSAQKGLLRKLNYISC